MVLRSTPPAMSASGPTYSMVLTASSPNVAPDYLLDESSEEAGALWLDAWSLGRNATLAAEANALTAEWVECIAGIVRSGVNAGEFHVADVDVAARRLLTMIDGLGAQMVGPAVPSEEAKYIARSYFTSELGLSARKAISDSSLTPPQ